jgi:ubiquinone/menaquinone biosynthesis C-methylase UbiE
MLLPRLWLKPHLAVIGLCLAWSMWAVESRGFAQDADDPNSDAPASKQADEVRPNGARIPMNRGIPKPLEVYKGRRIAQTMHYLGAEWLIRDTREREERCSIMLAALGVKRGMTICDMGCGNGFYTLQMAKMVGPEGHIYGVDIQPEMLKFLNDRADREGIRNISPVLGTAYDPRLPKCKIDMILCVDVYHEFSFPEQMLHAMRESLSPRGTVVLVEYRGEDPNVPIKPEHKMTKEQILKELIPNGFKVVKQFDKLPWQHMMWFGRSDSPDSEVEETPATKAAN